ncbi:NAD(P)/FAD-dependent oxidoreductase [Cysteiniphilum sp. 6C5]|uniref:NAD(P)/FAD-dependent oxidoreductase n=1 Tax=unclassified Cysteiniphilum TaxID=2610889 RepID=UPI003F855BC1
MEKFKPKILSELRNNTGIWKNSLQDWSWQASSPNRLDCENFYQASINKLPNHKRLVNNCKCDVLVIGAGLLGSSAAMHLAESGVDVILIDQDQIGVNASGRNGGQLTPGLARWEACNMLQEFSLDEAKRLWHFTARESFDTIKEIIQKYDLEVDYVQGHLTAAIHQGHMDALKTAMKSRAKLGDNSAKIISQQNLKKHVDSDLYYGGLLDCIGGHIHPLALNLGLVYALLKHGGKVYENTKALNIDQIKGKVVVETEGGKITANKVVIATHVSTFEILKQEGRAAIPFYSYVSVTEPLPIAVEKLIPSNVAVYDTSLQIDYFRQVRGNRVLFGGSGSGSRWALDKALDYLQQRVTTVFPQLGDVKLDYCWSGTTDLTVKGPTAAYNISDKIYSVFGWSGHGVAQTVRIGKAICDKITNQNDDFDMLCKVPNINLPMARMLAPAIIPAMTAILEVQSKLFPDKLISF